MARYFEVERKWLAGPAMVALTNNDDVEFVTIEQAYFGPGARVRIETEGDDIISEITIKTPTSSTELRHEYSYPIPLVDAQEIMYGMNKIVKYRYNIGGGFMLDVFDNELHGLLLLEKEYKSIDESRADTLPDTWLGVEVTNINTFNNSNLVGKRWDPEVGLLIDPGPSTQFGGEPFPPYTEFKIITGDEEDFMPPPLIIP